MTLVVPDAIPVKMPEPIPIVPVAGTVLLHVPPTGELLSVIDEPSHTTDGPPMAAGNGFTVTAKERVQPAVLAVTMFTVPAALPVTTPVALTDAIAGLLLVHVTPGVVLVSVIVLPTHTAVGPVTTAGSGFTVSITDVLQPLGASV